MLTDLIIIWMIFFIYFIFIRSFYSGIKLYQLNNSAYKKRKKGETFIEWLFYLRYKEEIPKRLLIPYYFILPIFPAATIVCIFIHLSNLSRDIALTNIRHTLWVSGIHMITLKLLYWSPKRGGMAYDRWIVKKRGQKPKNKKK